MNFVELLKGELGLADLAAEDEVDVPAVAVHVVLEVIVPGGKVFRIVTHVAGSAQAVGVGAVVPVFDDLNMHYQSLNMSSLCSFFQVDFLFLFCLGKSFSGDDVYRLDFAIGIVNIEAFSKKWMAHNDQ
jgi:hypothetical protein